MGEKCKVGGITDKWKAVEKNKYICEALQGADETLKQEKGKDRFL